MTDQETSRREPRHVRRTKSYLRKINGAPTGMDAFEEARNWALGEIAKLREYRPDDADAAARDLALKMAAYIQAIPRAKFGKPGGEVRP